MATCDPLEAALEGPEAAMAAGRALALALEGAGLLDRPLTILLKGPLGSGKTTFAKGFGEALGVDPDDIVSPTFPLAVTFQGRRAFSHLDLYRLGGEGDALSEFMEAGLDELLDGISLIEWPERLPDSFWPEGGITALFTPLQEEAPSGGPSENPSGAPSEAPSPPRRLTLLGPLPPGLPQLISELLSAIPRPRP